MKRPALPYVLLALSTLALIQGCATIDPDQERKEHTQAFLTQLKQEEARLLAQPLTLDDCIRIALTNNYTIRLADLDTRLATFNKKIAFSAFLPQIASSYGYNTLDNIPSSKNMDLHMTVGTISMPLFAPTTWFLYGAARDGYATAEIAANYTRQNIILQTTIHYYQFRLQLDMISALESQLIAAHALTNRIEGLAAEGFVSTWERDQARHLVDARAASLSHAKRQSDLLRATLLQTLGLNPLAPLQLNPALPPLQKYDEPLQAMVLTALQEHPELSLADRLIVARENQVRQAFANFVPTLGAFAELRWVDLSSFTTLFPEVASSSSMWMAGFSAAWTVFNGFAHYNNLQIAKTERTKSQREREAAFLSVIVRVATAEGALRDTVEQRRVSESAYLVARAKFEDYDARTKEGLLPQSEALDAQALRDFTQLQFVQTTYLERMAGSALDLAMGVTLLPESTVANP
jgi:outer membrane protein TolC